MEMRIIMSIKVYNFWKICMERQEVFFESCQQCIYKNVVSDMRKVTAGLCRFFLKSETLPQPMVVNIETINRCISTCSFFVQPTKRRRRGHISGWRRNCSTYSLINWQSRIIRGILHYIATMSHGQIPGLWNCTNTQVKAQGELYRIMLI